MFFGKKNKIRVIFFATVGVLLAGFVFGLNLVKAQTIKTTKGTLDISAYILNQENKEIPNGKYQVRFAIYSKDRSEKDPYPSDDDKNSRIWEEEQEVEISSGVFNTYLGLVSALPENIDLAASEYYLGIRIGEDSESIPRKKIGYVPSAINAINSVNSTFVNGATTGIAQGNILLLGKNGKIDLDRLPTGTDANSLVLGDDGRLHDQNTDTGTNSTEFNIGNGTGVNSNFNLTVSNASNKPAIRFNGLSQKWELSNDGTTFAELGGGSALQSQIDQRALIGHTHSTADIISGTLSASRGGTGLDGAFATDGQLLIGNGTGYSLGNLSSSDSSIVITNGSGAIDLVSSLGTNVDISSETNLTASGLLLNLTGDNLSINEGILTDGRLCTYSSTDGLICDTLSSSVGHAPVSIGSPANGLSVNGAQTISLALASATTDGALNSSDWNIFNNKVSSQWITTGSDIYYLAGNVGIGTSSIAERLTVAGNIQLSGSIFATNTSQDIGTATERFRYGYFENLDVNNISVGGLDISGSIANIFTINSNNATNDMEDSFLAFDRGENGGVSNLPATIQWDSANDIFVTNYPLSISGNATATGFSVGGETITDWTGTGVIISGGALTASLGTSIDISDETNLAVGGTLLARTDDTLSLREGVLANGRLCTYDTTSGLVCNTDSTTVGHNALTINAIANGLSVDASQVLFLSLASTSATGALSNTDWNTFNNKQNTISGDTEIVLTGNSLSIAASIARDSELHSAVTLSGQTYLSLVGQALTASQINLASHVTGTLPIANGGTGATSLNDLITLGTHTAGSYISTITGNTQIVVGGVGAENATATLSIGADSIGDTQLEFNTGQNLTTMAIKL
ncbi:MAG: hypothetical protein UR66_C0012G0014 [Candidatus Moranbacteria bacterium GW2011_GWE1_35_17]|nr:MAG: hypothetical protein UR66_C0012G0014 [Candidatus Moranbacteria bacterium GW2011_GWE1_35_17]